MSDKICIFNYANINFQSFKKIPSTNEYMTKNDIVNFSNIEPNYLYNYDTNRLVPINKIKLIWSF